MHGVVEVHYAGESMLHYCREIILLCYNFKEELNNVLIKFANIISALIRNFTLPLYFIYILSKQFANKVPIIVYLIRVPFILSQKVIFEKENQSISC